MKDTASINSIIQEIEPKLQDLEKHSLYNSIQTISELKLFMERHVFAVFDFMSLVKTIQKKFAPADNFWMPPKNKKLARFINEIVLAEESDEIPDGSFMSHFELYLESMTEIKADTKLIENFLNNINEFGLKRAINDSNIPMSAKTFIKSTFDIIEEGKIHKIAAAFCFGREKAIPLMFDSILKNSGIEKNQAPLFNYYLDRHIEIDGDSHGPLAIQMIAELCHNDPVKIQEAKQAAIDSIENRMIFWDEIMNELKSIPALTHNSSKDTSWQRL